jgi:hypothetical protein
MTFSRTCISNLRLVALWLAFSQGTAAVQLRIVDDQIWLDARDTTLHRVLESFADLGIYVRIAPGLDRPIDLQIVDEPVSTALSALIGPHSYALVWDRLEGPVGDWHRLAEILIFRSGARHEAEPLTPRPFGIAVAQAADGSFEFVADEIIIGFAHDADQAAIRLLIRELGATVVESIPELGIYRLRLPAGSNVTALVARLAEHPLVGRAEPNYVYRMPPPMTAVSAGSSTIGAAAPQSGMAPVAILDSGLNLLPELSGFVVGGFNALEPLGDFADTAGHGTQMALVAAGLIRPGGAPDGVGGVPILPIRAFTDEGTTSNFTQMRSLFYALDQGARVMNLSWGSPVDSEFLRQATLRARSEGLVVVASTGNQGSSQPMYPAAYDHVIGVGASLPDGSHWPQSNVGNAVFLAAPGTADFPVGYQGQPGPYAGTSIAAATVSHALGLYFQRNPQATAEQATRALQSAVSQSGTARNAQLGHGVLDADALQRLLR